MVHALKVGLPVADVLIVYSVYYILSHDEKGEVHLGILMDEWRHQILMMDRRSAYAIPGSLQSFLVKPFEMDFELSEHAPSTPDPRERLMPVEQVLGV
jgi:hypothetical protein